MTHSYVTQKDQFLLTSLPFNKRPFRSNILSYVILCVLDENNIYCLQLWEGTDNAI